MIDYWTENGIEKPQAIVVCAACKLENGVIVTGARHWDAVMVGQVSAMGYPEHAPRHDDGFINQFGEFLTREEAMRVVKESGQPFNKARNGGSDNILFSEGLY